MQFYDSIFSPLVINIVRYFVFAGVPFLIIYMLFPDAFLNQKIQKRLAKNKDFIREILHSLLTSVMMTLVAFLLAHTPFQQYTTIYTEIDEYPLWWLGVSVLLALVLQDAYFYWTHRAMHHPKLFRWVHLLHHRSVNPSPWTSYSIHIFEALVDLLLAPLLILLLPMHPYAIISFTTIFFAFQCICPPGI